MPEYTTDPFTFDILHGEDILLSQYDNHIVRRLSAMKDQFLDQKLSRLCWRKKIPCYTKSSRYDDQRHPGELLHGISIVHPGKVGNEYNMTKGHFHTVLDTAEVYYCLRGQGYMVMETPEGEWAVESLIPQKVLYVPPRWAHRSVNTSPDEDLVTFFVYPGNAGHDYGSIEIQGFRKLVVQSEDAPQVIDNPRWLPPEKR